MDQVGNRIKRERTMRGWSQRDLAKKAKVTAETVSTIETGQHEPRPSTLRKLAGAFEIEVRDLFEEPALAGKAEGPLSLEWARKADLDLLRLVIRDAPSEQLREIGAALVADFYRVQTREELVEKGPVSRGPYVNAFTRAGIFSEELVRRGEDPLERHVLTLKRRQDALHDEPGKAVQEDAQEHWAG